uniref:NADH dehydrogenase subunit 6 n=1 Tax=Erpobdella testacea TaxID=92797 RepID=A0A7D6WFV4_9ANNE|nr:NADH dehydrogenase subunit 6 [Erpobdella testacea]
MMTLSMFLFVLSLMSMIMNTPVLLLFNILMMALTISWLTGILFSSWYSFLIFLIYIGGMMVMFSYFVALSPNQYMKIKSVITIMMMTMLMVSIPTYFSNNLFQLNNTMKFDSLYLYNPTLMSILLFMIMMLLMMMLIVVKMVSTSKGPLRPFMYV